jgi:mRNA interferase YafQ
MLTVVRSARFDKDLRLAERQRKDLQKLEAVVVLLANEQPLPERLRDHPLKGDWVHFRNCHIEPD